MREIGNGGQYDAMQKLLNSFWIPDYRDTDSFIFHYDAIIIPDEQLAKYLVEAYYVKEHEVRQKLESLKRYEQANFFANFDVMDPNTAYEARRYRDSGNKKRDRKFPPLAVLGYGAYHRLKGLSKVDRYK